MIKNLNYGNTSEFARFKDTTSQYVPVPCGRCSVCLSLKQQYLVQRVQMESLSHDLYFGTLTYNNETLRTANFGEYTIAYADVTDWQKMIKMIRKHEDLPEFKYFLVSEYGGKRHRPHFHFILSLPKNDKDTLADRVSMALKLHNIFLKYWRRNLGSTRKPIWQNLCTYKINHRSRNFDLHYLNPYATKDGVDDVAFYVTKYCLKFDKWVDKFKSKLFFTLDEESYKDALSVFLPKRTISKGFGSVHDPQVLEHLNKGINLSLQDPDAMFPYFISPVNGSTFPLAPYYASKLLTFADLEIFNSRKPLINDFDCMVDSTKDVLLSEVIAKELRLSKVQDWLEHQHTLEDDSADFVNAFDFTQNEKTCSFNTYVFDGFDFDGSDT